LAFEATAEDDGSVTVTGYVVQTSALQQFITASAKRLGISVEVAA